MGGRHVDQLVRVYRKDGEEQWLLVHVEVQGYAQKPLAFERRMYVYNYRIFDRYDRHVIGLAVLTDEREGFRPGAYRLAFGDFRLEMTFPVRAISDRGFPKALLRRAIRCEGLDAFEKELKE